METLPCKHFGAEGIHTNMAVSSFEFDVFAAQIGSVQFGSGQFSGQYEIPIEISTSKLSGLRTSVFSGKQIRRKSWIRGNDYKVRRRRPPSGGGVPIVRVSSSTGAGAFVIRSDVESPLIRDLMFVIEKGDCRTFRFVLNKLPDKPIPNLSYISINIGNSPFDWYTGKIIDPPQEDDNSNNGFEFTGVGFSDEFRGISADGVIFPSGTDYGEIAYYIATEIIANTTNIFINENKINRETGIPTASNLDFSASSIDKVLQTIAIASGQEFGVDGDREFFFLPKETNYSKTYVSGHSIFNIKQNRDTKDIKNNIIGTRQNGAGEGGAGWIVADTVFDLTSIREFAQRNFEAQVPGNWSDEDITNYITRLLDESKAPKLRATGELYYLRNGNDYVRRGNSRIILPFKKYNVVYDSLSDPETTFDKIGSGTLAISEFTNFFVENGACMKLEWGAGSDGDRAEKLPVVIKGKISKIRFYFRGGTPGINIRFGFGDGVWNEYTRDISVSGASLTNFEIFDWDISSLDIERIDRVGFEVITEEAGEIYLDGIRFYVEKFEQIVLSNDKQTYRFSPNESKATCEFGVKEKYIEDYMRELFSQTAEARFVGQIR